MDANAALKQSRLRGSLCLGCGSPDHWLKDCPSYTVQNAQLASASLGKFALDAEGMVNSAWTVQALEPERVNQEKECDCYAMPALNEFLDESYGPKLLQQPSVLLQYASGDSSAFIIADTGCQRQVAGTDWHVRKALEIQPLQAVKHPDRCRFSFGPGPPLSSLGRYVYPVSIAGKHFAMCISQVDAKAPALMSRKAFESLGAVPDVHKGQIYFRAMDCVATLWLSPCGHLAIRLDDWGEQAFPWPPKRTPQDLPDIISDEAFECPSNLQNIVAPAKPVPHALTSFMAGSLAEATEQPAQFRGPGQPDGPVLLSLVAAGTKPSEKSHSEPVCPAWHGEFDAELHGGDCGPGAEQEVREVAGSMPTPQRSSRAAASRSRYATSAAQDG